MADGSKEPFLSKALQSDLASSQSGCNTFLVAQSHEKAPWLSSSKKWPLHEACQASVQCNAVPFRELQAVCQKYQCPLRAGRSQANSCQSPRIILAGWCRTTETEAPPDSSCSYRPLERAGASTSRCRIAVSFVQARHDVLKPAHQACR